MKKIMLFFGSLYLIITFVGCGPNNTKNIPVTGNTNSKDTTKVKTPTGSISHSCCYSLTNPENSTMMEYRDANPLISYYAKDYNTNRQVSSSSTYSFYFNVDANFRNYINNISTFTPKYIHFILTQDENSDDLIMLLSAIDNFGNHIYMKSTQAASYPTGTSTYWVFQNADFDDEYFPQDTLPIAGVISSSVMGTSYTNQRILADTAFTWIYNYYYNTPYKYDNICSYVFPSQVFINYVNNAINSGIMAVQVLLAENPQKSQPTIIITGVDENYNQILIRDQTDNKYYMLEFCTPCPVCAQIKDTYGLQLETIQNQSQNDTIEYNDKYYK